MAYTSNPYAGKARRLAVNDVLYGRCSKAQAARKYGVHRATIGKWLKRASKDHRVFIDTIPSRPTHHPNELKPEVVQRVVALRLETRRCAQILHMMLVDEGVSISLSSVKRILKRHTLLRRRKRKIKGDTHFKRPRADKPGALVQVDTIHFVTANYQRFYVYAVIDTYSRIGYAEYQPRISTRISCEVLERALRYFQFPVAVVQTDNGQEFGEYLERNLKEQNVRLRHTRIRKPNDNAHVERFIRTIQEECFDFLFPNLNTIEQKLHRYIDFYNNKRLHLGIQCRTPSQLLPRS